MNKFLKGCLISLTIATVYTFLVGHTSRKYAEIPVFYLLVAGIHLIQILGFIPAKLLNTEKFYDLFGSITFIIATSSCLLTSPQLSLKQKVAGAMVLIWTARLGSFLFYRILRVGEDSRFQAIKKVTPRFFMSWILQGLWVTLTAGPVFAFLTSPTTSNLIGWVQIIGVLIWLVGFLIESVADAQKFNFKFDKENKGKFIQKGLWKYSRHPNYCGEVLVWLGISIFVLRSLQNWQYFTMISPAFVYLLLSKVSGVPLLEAKAQKVWGSNEQYKKYKQATPILFPSFMGRGKGDKKQ